MTHFILGGGPTGLAVADGLTDIGEDYVLFERADDLRRACKIGRMEWGWRPRFGSPQNLH